MTLREHIRAVGAKLVRGATPLDLQVSDAGDAGAAEELRRSYEALRPELADRARRLVDGTDQADTYNPSETLVRLMLRRTFGSTDPCIRRQAIRMLGLEVLKRLRRPWSREFEQLVKDAPDPGLQALELVEGELAKLTVEHATLH
jgi:hypothetical protein